MARVTIEDCLEKVVNRFALSVAAMKRARLLLKGAPILSEETENKVVVSALREIAEEKVRVVYPVDLDKY
ncbi:MAG: DNA-directed RNA polymerase subunit omega [Candidatus Dadabacteria bacterium]|jgi:DNA-directed RNA polymerase subunit omega|nr:MAG: DNA-directed RNA polymerase subunit omega [Thermodesulfobacteriales bacterium]